MLGFVEQLIVAGVNCQTTIRNGRIQMQKKSRRDQITFNQSSTIAIH